MRKTPRGWIQIGESRTRGVARIPLGLKPSRDSRATSQRDSPIWIQPLGVFRYTTTVFADRLRPCSWKHDRSRGTTRPIESQPWAFGKLRCQTRVVNKHTNRHYQGASERHILFKIIMNICCFLTRIHSGWLERVSTWKVTVIHSLESVGCLVLFGSSQLSKSNCQRSTWLPCASHMGYSVHWLKPTKTYIYNTLT